MVDVRRNDGAAAGDLGTDKFRRDEGWNFGAETFAVRDAGFRLLQCPRAAEVLAMRDVDHFLGDDAGARELILRHQLACRAPPNPGGPRGDCGATWWSGVCSCHSVSS